MDPEIERKIQAVVEKPRLYLPGIDFSVSNPELLSHELGSTFQYFQRVEGEVGGLSLHVLLPNSPDNYVGRFVDGWVADETQHAKAFETLMGILGIETIEQVDENNVPAHNKVIGAVGKLSTAAHQVMEMVYHTMGALHEDLTHVGYGLLGSKLRLLGETVLAETMIKPIRADETHHLSYYRTTAKWLRDSLRPWQVSLARMIVSKVYAPVGAGGVEHKSDFGKVVLSLGDSTKIADLTSRVQKLADSLLKKPETDETGQNTKFVVEAIEECVEMARAA